MPHVAALRHRSSSHFTSLSAMLPGSQLSDSSRLSWHALTCTVCILAFIHARMHRWVINAAHLAGVPLRRFRGGVGGSIGAAAFFAAAAGRPRFRPVAGRVGGGGNSDPPSFRAA